MKHHKPHFDTSRPTICFEETVHIDPPLRVFYFYAFPGIDCVGGWLIQLSIIFIKNRCYFVHVKNQGAPSDWLRALEPILNARRTDMRRIPQTPSPSSPMWRDACGVGFLEEHCSLTRLA